MARAENSHYSAQHTDYWNEIVIVMHPGISINVVIYRYILCGAAVAAAAVHKDICSARYMVRVALVKMVLLSICIIYELLIFV